MAYTYEFQTGGQASVNALIQAIQKLDQVISGFARKTQESATATQANTSAAREAAAAARAYEQSQRALDANTRKLEMTITSTTAVTQRFKDATVTTKTELNTLGDVVRRVVTTKEDLGKAVRTTTQVLNAEGQVISQNASVVDKAKRTWSQWLSDLAHGSTILQNIKTVFSGVTGVFSAGMSIIDGITGSFTSLYNKVVSVGAPFETVKASLKGLLGAGAEPVIAQSEQIGRSSRYGATETGRGAVELAKAGMGADAIKTSLLPVLQAAEANTISVGKAAEIASVGMGQFKRTGEDAAKILQIYTSAANASQTDISGMAEAMKNAAPMAAVLGLDAQKTSTFLAMMAGQGITAERAGSQLQIALRNLSAITPRSAEALRDMGINVKELDLSNPVQWIGKFNQALQGMSDTEKVAQLSKIFGEGVTGMLPILEAGSAGFEKMFNDISAGLPQMAEFQKLQANTPEGAIKMAANAWDSVFISLMKVFATPIKEFWTAVAGALNTVIGYLDKVTAKFSAAGAQGVQGWLAAIKNMNVKDVFKGLSEALGADMGKIKAIFGGLVDLAKQMFAILWNYLVSDEVLGPLKGAGKKVIEVLFGDDMIEVMVNIGLKLGEGLVKGISAAAAKAATNPEAVVSLMSYVSKVVNPGAGIGSWIGGKLGFSSPKVAEAAPLPSAAPAVTTPAAPVAPTEDANAIRERSRMTLAQADRQTGVSLSVSERIARIQSNPNYSADQKRQLIAQARQDVGKPTTTATQARPTEPVENAALKKKIGSELASQTEESGLTEQQAAQQLILEKTMAITEAEKQQKEAREQSKKVLLETSVEIRKSGSEFEKWLLNPINKFKEALLTAKESFGAMADSLKTKRVDIAEKFGLTTPDNAAKAKSKITQDSLARDEKLLTLAQSPEERQRIQERMADKAASLAEGAGTQADKEKYAKQADKYLADAEESVKKAEELQMKRLDIEQKAAKENIKDYEAMATGAETSGGKASALEQLKDAYMTMGDVEKATKTQEEWKKAKTAAGAEEAEHLKRSAEAAEQNVSLMKQSLEILERIARNSAAKMSIPPSPAFAAKGA